MHRLARTAFVLSAVLGLLAPARASAHDPLEITTDAHVDVSGFNVHTTLSLDTAARICLTGAPPGRRFPVPDFSQFRPQFERCARDFYAVDSGGKRLTLLSLELSLSPEDDLEIRAVYARPSASPLSFEALGLKGLPQAAGIVLTVTGRRSFLGQKLLRPDDPRFERQITAEGEDVGTPPLPPPDSPVQRNGAYRLVLALFLTLLVSAGAFLAWRRRR